MINPISFCANNKLSIFHINDLHGQTDNLQQLVSASFEFDKKDEFTTDKLKLSGGDNVSGTSSEKNAMVAGFLNALKIDASAVGNHEFDNGLNSFNTFLNSIKTKFLCANVDIEDNCPIKNKISESIVKEINGTKYGIIGITTPELSTVSTDNEVINGVEVEDSNGTIEEVQDEINKMRQIGINRIILLSHSGKEFDQGLVKGLDGIDVVISGHSHDVIKGAVEGDNLLKSKSNEPVIILQAGENGRHYGVCDIEFNDLGQIVKVNNQLNKTTAQKSPVIEHIKNSYLGPSPIVGTLNSVDPFPQNKRISPCAWTNLLADGMKDVLGVDIAFVNSGNTRKVPATGAITERDIFETSPMNNKLLTTSISQKEVVKAIREASKSMVNAGGEPGLLQVSGIKYTIDTNGNLLEMYIKDEKIDINNPTDKQYSVAYDDFVADGREYPALKFTDREFKTYDFDKDKTAIEYIKKITNNGQIPLDVKDDGRVKIVQTSARQLSNNNMQSFLELTSLRNP